MRAYGLGLALVCLAVGACVTSRSTTRATPVVLYHESFGQGDPVILIHGLGGSSYTWRHIRDSLATRHRVIVIDLKGHGRSPKPRDDAYSLFDQADLVAAFILDQDLRNVTLVGNSFGGGVALVTAGRLIDEGNGRLERLVLLDSVAYPQRLPFYVAILRVPLIGPLAMSLLSPRKAVEMVLEKTFYDDDAIPEDAIEEYARALREPGGRHALIQTARLVTKNMEKLTDTYARIDVPTLIVWGRDDEIVPLRVGRRLQRELPDADLRIIPECGHAPQEECHTRVLPLIEAFLE